MKTEEFKLKIGLKIKAFRSASGLKQHELAAILGNESKSISNWERGINLPDVPTFMKIATALKVPLREFFDIDTFSKHSNLRNAIEDNLVALIKKIPERDFSRVSRLVETILKNEALDA